MIDLFNKRALARAIDERNKAWYELREALDSLASANTEIERLQKWIRDVLLPVMAGRIPK